MEQDPELITKLEGAERLLKAAIQLFFVDGDMLAVHALAAGSHEVLRTLSAKANKKGSILKDLKGTPKAFIDRLNHTHNFLKHADRDLNHILDFYEEQTQFWIFDAIVMFSKLTGGIKYKAFAVFLGWFLIEQRSLLKETAFADYVKPFKILEGAHSKKLFSEIIKNPSLCPMPDLL